MRHLTKNLLLSGTCFFACLAGSQNASADDFTMKFGGRFMYDVTSVKSDLVGGTESDTEVRRARLNVSGKLTSRLKYKVELNTDSSDKVNLEDIWVEYAPKGINLKIKAGQFNTPNSLDELTSSRFSSTIERAAFTDSFGFNRRLGLGVSTSGKRYTATAGVFLTNLEVIDETDGMAAAARVTYLPVLEEDRLVHVGASIRYRDQKDDSALRYRQRPFAHTAPRILATQRFAQKDTMIGVEAATIHKGFWATGEYALTQSDNRDKTAGDATFDGYFGEVGYFIGGKRTYKGGKFRRPDVDAPLTKGGLGALSLVARYDTLNLKDDTVGAGDLDTFIVGAEWWPTSKIHIGVNYFDAKANRQTSTSPNRVDATGFVTRLQFDF